MGLRSVEAVEFFGDDSGEHFALDAGEGRFTEHDRPVEVDAGLEGAGVDAHDVDDVPDAPGAFDGFIE